MLIATNIQAFSEIFSTFATHFQQYEENNIYSASFYMGSN